MSIAVNAVLHPSRLLRLALVAFALSSSGVAGILVLGAPVRVYFPDLIAACCALAALLAARAAWRRPIVRVLDVSGPGELRLSVQQRHGTDPPQCAPAQDEQAQPLQLLPASTLWPSLLLLLVRQPDPPPPAPRKAGEGSVLIILPDSVPPEQFRRIAVAARAIARRDNKFFENNKIL